MSGCGVVAVGEHECLGWVRRAGGERVRRRLRDRASSWDVSGQSGGVGGSWRASCGASWYWGGERGGPPRPWIRRVGVRRRQRLVVRVV